MLLNNLKSRILLFKIQSYLYFTLSGFLATFGNGFIHIAIAWHIAKQSNTISAQAILIGCLWGPGILLSPVAGVVADSVNKKNMVILSNLIRGIIMLHYAWLLVLDIAPSIYILAVILGITASFYAPPSMAIVKEMVPPGDLLNANTTVSSIYELGSILGMGVAGILIKWLTITNALVLGGTCFVVASICNIIMAYQPTSQRKESMNLYSMVNDYSLALKYVGSNGQLLKLYVLQTFLMIPIATVPILLVPFAKTILYADVGQFSHLEILFSLGAIAGSILISLSAEQFGAKRALSAFSFCLTTSLLLFADTHHIAYAYFLYTCIGISTAAWSIAVSQAQSWTANEYQGRLQATFYGLSGIFILLIYIAVILWGDMLSLRVLYRLEALIALAGLLFTFSLKKEYQII